MFLSSKFANPDSHAWQQGQKGFAVEAGTAGGGQFQKGWQSNDPRSAAFAAAGVKKGTNKSNNASDYTVNYNYSVLPYDKMHFHENISHQFVFHLKNKYVTDMRKFNSKITTDVDNRKRRLVNINTHSGATLVPLLGLVHLNYVINLPGYGFQGMSLAELYKCINPMGVVVTNPIVEKGKKVIPNVTVTVAGEAEMDNVWGPDLMDNCDLYFVLREHPAAGPVIKVEDGEITTLSNYKLLEPYVAHDGYRPPDEFCFLVGRCNGMHNLGSAGELQHFLSAEYEFMNTNTSLCTNTDVLRASNTAIVKVDLNKR